MDAELTQALRALLQAQRIAALGTLHDGAPYVSMVPFALLPKGPDFVIHVSALAAHTKDMLANPAVSLLVIAPERADVSPQATARLTIQGDAVERGASHPSHAEAKSAYLSLFPTSAPTFELSDFSLFTIRPRTLRFVAGFAQARSLTPETLAGVLDSMAREPVPLSKSLVGTWILTSREDLTRDGAVHPDPGLGSDPVAILVYDTAGNFAAQFMKSDRSRFDAADPAAGTAPNNSRAQGGYDAYFGTYTVDDGAGTVTQRLTGALSAENVGMVLTRAMTVEGDELTIRLETNALDGVQIVRTLRWRRAR